MASVPLGEYDAGQRHRGAGTRIDRESADGIKRPARHQQDAAHGTVAGDAQIGKIIEAKPIEFRAGKKPDVGLPIAQCLGAMNGKIETKVEQPSLRSMYETPHERPGIQITDS